MKFCTEIVETQLTILNSEEGVCNAGVRTDELHNALSVPLGVKDRSPGKQATVLFVGFSGHERRAVSKVDGQREGERER